MSSFKRFLLITILLFSLSQVSAETPKSIEPEKYRIGATKIESQIKIDGELNEKDWSLATPVSDFVQLEPEEGQPATEKTEVWVLYDEKNLYLGISCFDQSPKKIVANQMCRDADLDQNDFVGIILDTFHDHRNCFFFSTNPLGAQLDGLITDEGKNKNLDWDGIWDCATSKDSLGWYAEISIPFKTLRFEKKEKPIWGINFGRLIRRKNEFCFWTPMLRDYGMNSPFKVSMVGHLDGLENLKKTKNIQFSPYVLGKLERDYEEKRTKGSADLGLDLKYGVTSNLILDFTFNTDFAQIEADQYQINLSRFSLFFPEKRDFFLEGAGVFHFGERIPPYGDPPQTILFFSRKIGLAEEEALPIFGGLKLSGKVGKSNIGFLNMQVKEKEIEDEGVYYIVPSTNFTAFRLKRDFLSQSNFGFIFLNKEENITNTQMEKIENNPDTYFAEDYGKRYNRVLGFDGNFTFLKNLNLGGFVSKSFTPDLKRKDWASSVYAEWRNDLFSFDLSYTDIAPNFNSEMGFILRDDIRKSKLELGYSPRPKILFIRQSFFFVDGAYITDQTNLMLNRENSFGVFNLLENGGEIMFGVYESFERLKEEDEFDIREDKWVEVGDYKSKGFFSKMGTDRSRKFSLNLGFNGGDFYNGKILSFDLHPNFTPGPRLSFSFFWKYNKIKDLPIYNSLEDRKERIEFDTHILGGRITYSFSTKLFYRGFVQWNTDDEELSANLLLSYIYRPGSNFYLVYNEVWNTPSGAKKVEVKDRTVLFKLVHLFNL
jgi:hypothetical protein